MYGSRASIAAAREAIAPRYVSSSRSLSLVFSMETAAWAAKLPNTSRASLVYLSSGVQEPTVITPIILPRTTSGEVMLASIPMSTSPKRGSFTPLMRRTVSPCRLTQSATSRNASSLTQSASPVLAASLRLPNISSGISIAPLSAWARAVAISRRLLYCSSGSRNEDSVLATIPTAAICFILPSISVKSPLLSTVTAIWFAQATARSICSGTNSLVSPLSKRSRPTYFSPDLIGTSNTDSVP